MNNDQWIRKIGIILFNEEKTLDLSKFHVTFRTSNADIESPNNAWIRIYNLSLDTMNRIKAEFSQVTLNAGYVNGNYGVIFQGTIKYFAEGKQDNVSRFLDLFCADGDIFYNNTLANRTIAKGATPLDMIKLLANDAGVPADTLSLKIDAQHKPLLRGAVVFGMMRAKMRDIASTLDAGWSVQDGSLTFTDNTGYREDDVVKINSGTGMIGIPRQTPGGIEITCLLNSRLRIGRAIQLNDNEIIKLLQQDPNAAPIPYDQNTGFQPLAALSGGQGLYRAFVVEHEGDSRGSAWYSNIVGLAINPSLPSVIAVDRR
jgi:hypothetical protein